mgnify:CR=1 FL=1
MHLTSHCLIASLPTLSRYDGLYASTIRSSCRWKEVDVDSSASAAKNGFEIVSMYSVSSRRKSARISASFASSSSTTAISLIRVFVR